MVQQLYVSQEEKTQEIMYQQQNAKIVADSEKTILQVATEFSLMKLIKSSIHEYDGIEIEKSFDPRPHPKMSFLGTACKTGNIETIKWILSCMKKNPTMKKDLESQEEPPLQTDYNIFFKGIGLKNEILPITLATKPVLDFLLHEGNYLMIIE